MPMVETFREYDRLVSADGGRALPSGVFPCSAFADLRDFVLSADAADDFFRYSKLPGAGECITLQNHVGAIRFADGKQLEILPKICGVESQRNEQSRRMVLDMLRCLRDAPFKESGMAQLNTCRMPLSELFIRMFLDEVHALVRGGIRSDYVLMRGNLHRVRGRILPAQQVRCNLLHPERIFCAYDEFQQNCPENRLVKATLLTLRGQTADASLQRDISRMLAYFDEVAASLSPAADFSRVRQDRNRREYARLMEWARVFLQGRSYSNYSGKGNALAMLFPMERLFENYVAHHIRRAFTDWQVATQARSSYLCEDESRHARDFMLKPDILLSRGNQKVVMDTKWKLLQDNPAKHYGVSQTDMYQMNAYADRFGAAQIFLLYPLQEWMTPGIPVARYGHLPNGASVTLFPIGLTEMKQSLGALRALLPA